jgi:hypothetical protein
MDPKVCELFLRTLDKAHYHVKTQLGVSDEYYCTTRKKTIHGPGQGGKGSPAIWVAISCILMKCLQKKSPGCSITDPLRAALVKFYSTGFVDDITIWLCNFMRSLGGNETPEQIADEMAVAAQWWEQLLHATGGKLELPKCFYYIMYWVFDDDGKARMLLPEEIDATVMIVESGSKQQVMIKAESPYKSHKTLGAMESPSGDYSDEHLRLREKSNGKAIRIASAQLSIAEANRLYFSVYVPSMTYSLAVGTLPLDEAARVQSHAIRAILPAMGFNRNSPSSIVFGPTDLGGIGLRHLFAEQGAIKVTMILEHMRRDTVTGQTLMIMFLWAQAIAGTSKPILEDVAKSLPQLDNEAWLVTLREFLALSELRLRLTAIQLKQPPRTNDRFIMDLFEDEEYKVFSDSDIVAVNMCRIFLRVTTVADISNAAGDEIERGIYNCEEWARRQSDALWPQQTRPGAKYIKVWRQFLSKLCKYCNLKLKTPLGGWLASTPCPNRSAWYNSRTGEIWCKFPEGRVARCEIASVLRGCWTATMTSEVRGALATGPDDFWVPLDCTARNGRRISTSDP